MLYLELTGWGARQLSIWLIRFKSWKLFGRQRYKKTGETLWKTSLCSYDNVQRGKKSRFDFSKVNFDFSDSITHSPHPIQSNCTVAVALNKDVLNDVLRTSIESLCSKVIPFEVSNKENICILLHSQNTSIINFTLKMQRDDRFPYAHCATSIQAIAKCLRKQCNSYKNTRDEYNKSFRVLKTIKVLHHIQNISIKLTPKI